MKHDCSRDVIFQEMEILPCTKEKESTFFFRKFQSILIILLKSHLCCSEESAQGALNFFSTFFFFFFFFFFFVGVGKSGTENQKGDLRPAFCLFVCFLVKYSLRN